MRRPIAHALTIGFLLSGAALAQGPTVEEIVARNIEAKGGHALLKETTSVRTTARGSMQGRVVTIVTSTKRPFFVRNEMTLAPPAAARRGGAQPPEPQKMVQAFDGERMWMAMGAMPPQALPAGPQTEALKRTSQIDSPLFDYKERGIKVELGEPLAEGSRKLHHLVVTPPDAPAMHYYIDPETNLEAKLVIDVEQGGQTTKMEMRFSDFRSVDGRKVPFTVTQFINGAQSGQVNFDKIEFNVPLDDAIFRMPKAER